jgi:hypothetical protein
MKVLLLEHGTDVETGVERALADAGHEVVRCHQPGAPSFPCLGLRDGGVCPLDDGLVAVAVDVAPSPDVYPEHNDGVTCALRRNIPLVVAGDAPDETTASLATAVTPTGHVVDAVETAAHATARRPTMAATSALRTALDGHGMEGVGASAAVHRDGANLAVSLDVDGPLSNTVKQAAAVRVLAAVNRVEPHAAKVGVSFVPRG